MPSRFLNYEKSDGSFRLFFVNSVRRNIFCTEFNTNTNEKKAFEKLYVEKR